MDSDILDRLHFGRDEAELDATAGGLLRSGFLETAAYRSALAGRKRLIIGRKGSGKSAICMMLAAEEDGTPTCLVTPDDASGDEIRRFDLRGLRAEKAKELMWRYVFSVQVAKFLVAHAREMHPRQIPLSVDALRRFLAANGEGLDFKFHEKFWRILQRLKSSLSLEAFGGKIALEIEAPSDGLKKNNQLEVIENNIALALKDLGCGSRHPMPLLLVDRLEELWANDPDSDAMIIGLLLAAKQLPQRFEGVRCVVFLRSDIYDLLEFGERDKLHGEEMRIDWNRSALRELLRTRAASSLGCEVAAAVMWGSIFPSHIDDQPAGDYLIDHTLMRPRDLIQLANRCRDVAEQNGQEAIRPADIADALPIFSGWKLQDLVDEYSVNYPFLSRLLPLFEDGGFLVLLPNLATLFSPVLEPLRKRYPEFADNLNVEGLVDILYGIGFLGIKRSGKAVYSYERQGRVEAADREFYVHPCFRPALRCLRPVNIAYIDAGRQINRALGQNVGTLGGDIVLGTKGVRPSHDFRSLALIERSADRILGFLAEAQLPQELGDEIARNVADMIDNLGMVETVGTGAALAYAHSAREYVICLADHLRRDGSEGDDRIYRFSEDLRAEARRLGDELSRLNG